MQRIPIAAKLLAVYLVPAIGVLLGFSWLAHRSASGLLEDELGRRLAGVAATAASSLADENLSIIQAGDEDTRTYRNVRRRLDELKQASGVRRIYVFDAHGASLCDTERVPIGERYYALSRSDAEVRSARSGTPTSSMLFVGADGQRYKSAFATLIDGSIVVGVDGAAAMYAQLGSLRRTMLTIGALAVIGFIALSFVAARLLVGPLVQLSRAAQRIGRGDLDEVVVRRSRDEVGEVAETLEHMRQLLRARDERTQMMLAGIAHEVRNPLGGLALYAGLLREELADRPELLDYTKKVERELEHLKVIVNDFLEYARRARPTLGDVDVAALCHELAQLVAPDASVRKIELVVDVEPVHVRADAGQLRRALLNLVHNAIQASPDGGEVTLKARRDQGVVIEVIDRGGGIPDDKRHKIWAPFYTTKQKGTGLGLAFVREIVNDHDGRIDLETGPTGTRFSIVLPFTASAPTE